MRKIRLSIALLLMSVCGFGQSPIHWIYSTDRINDSIYEVHIAATLDAGWHVYAQLQKESSVALPTKIVFNPNPVIRLKGIIKESGKLINWMDRVSGITANEYSEKVDFVQKIVLKAKVKTILTGNLSFQTCTDEMCLPPKTISFSIAIS
jgi:hypothetical protein